MLASKLYCPTLRDDPAEAEVASHKYMLKAGMIRKNASGFYSFLPLARRSVLKIEKIIREEMEKTGAQEIMMPIVQPAEIWQESGRWDVYGKEMFKLADRHGNEYCLAPTHEELITTLVRNELRSYKQLPVNLYQIQNKYRDEIRPRFGLMRSREFVMQDSYSFDTDQKGLEKSYQAMYEAYSRIFTRCGLQYRTVLADSGQIGGKHSHEFMALADSGEADIVTCTQCAYAADVEQATPNTLPAAAEPLQAIEKFATPHCSTIEDLVQAAGVPAEKTIKAVALDIDGKLVLCMVRGDHEVNEVAVQHVVGGHDATPASAELLQKYGLVPGYMSPLGAAKTSEQFHILVDPTAMQIYNGVTGANEEGFHYRHVTPSRDFTGVQVAPIRLITAADGCPECGAPVQLTRGIEVGQVFQLGTKYSEALQASFLDKDGKAKPFVMGCYGIGVTRTMAAAIEQYHDERGILWPVAIAPYEAVILPLNMKDEVMVTTARELYTQLSADSSEIVLDDRPERAGVKFNDADLIGYPVQIVVGKDTKTKGTVEIKVRRTGVKEVVPVRTAVGRVQAILRELRASGQ
ncbi:proline--tRNA ligase [Veillonellaceae bacterium DNF00751]|uniref:proline--tRNA ligase n=1 Tax=uncultured Megasphaera sp. TaxID=165188 RepID=UPI0007845156|nr:proline--tRNA ligase [uncultured Megasphaera sp.]KXB93704.1 proline--tRNA ligase [Veillonellaceae bacterium DNF00751]